jgi:hypothetical protein
MAYPPPTSKATILDQFKYLVPGAQQLYQNVGFNRQQSGQSSGYVPRAWGGSGYVAPSFGVGQAYASDYMAPSPVGTGGANVTQQKQAGVQPWVNPNLPGGTDTGGGGGGGGGSNNNVPGGGDGGPNPLDLLRRQAQDQYNRLRGAYDQGMGYYNSARDALGRKMDEFGRLRDDTAQDIFDTSESGRGQLQEAAEGSSAQLTNRLLSQGVAGSALDYWKNKQEGDKMRSLGDLTKRRESGDRENMRAYQANQNWGLGLEDQIGQGERGLQAAKQQGIAELGTANVGMLENLYNEAIRQSGALQAAQGNISGYNPVMAQLQGLGVGDMRGLASNLSAGLGQVPQFGQQNVGMNTNPTMEGKSLIDQDKLLRGYLQ